MVAQERVRREQSVTVRPSWAPKPTTQRIRVELISTSDPYTTLRPGTRGTVVSVDDAGTTHVEWDDGRTLGLIDGEDQWRRI